jgi:hypothetical protein
VSFLDGAVIDNETAKTPYFGILYGPPGVGKSWLASYAERPFYIATEKGCEKVPGIGRYKDANGKLILPTELSHFYEMMGGALSNTAIRDNYKTIVIDSGKFVDVLISAHIIKENPTEVKNKVQVEVESLADYNFGRGYEKALAVWQRIMAGFDKMRDKGFNVILIAHSSLKNETTIAGEDYKKNKIDLLQFGNISVPNLLYAKADWCYFMRSEGGTRSIKNNFGGKKTLADNSAQQTVVYTRGQSGFDAKVRTANIENIPDYYEIDIYDSSTSKQIFIDLEK